MPVLVYINVLSMKVLTCIRTCKEKRVGEVEYLAASEGPVKIQYKCLAPIFVFPEMKLRSLVIYKTEL